MKILRNLLLVGCAAILLNSCGKSDGRHNNQYRQNLDYLLCADSSSKFLIDEDGEAIRADVKIDTATQKCLQGFACDNNLSVCLVINLKDRTKEYMFIDEDGDVELNINEKFGEEYKCSGFSEGIAFISAKDDDSKVKAINEGGDILFEFSGTPIAPYFNGITLFRDANNNYGIMDNKGKVLVPGTNKILLNSENYLFGMIEFLENGKWGMKNSKNEIVIKPQFDVIPQALSENRFLLKDSLTVIDATGKTIVEANKYTRLLRDGDLLKFTAEGNSGWMDFDGKIIIQPKGEYSNPQTLFNGDKWAAVENNGKWSFIDRTGKTVLESKYRVALPFFNEENCAVILSGDSAKDYEFSLMNREGKLVGDPFKGLNASTMKRALSSYLKNWTKL